MTVNQELQLHAAVFHRYSLPQCVVLLHQLLFLDPQSLITLQRLKTVHWFGRNCPNCGLLYEFEPVGSESKFTLDVYFQVGR